MVGRCAVDRPELRMSADYGASPLWTAGENIPIEYLSLSSRLTAELHRWAGDFDVTTPKGSRMDRGGYVPTDWVDRGQRLARQLQEEVGDVFLVTYNP